MDEYDEDEDIKAMIQGIPVIADKGFLEKYGLAFSLSFTESRDVILSPYR